MCPWNAIDILTKYNLNCKINDLKEVMHRISKTVLVTTVKVKIYSHKEVLTFFSLPVKIAYYQHAISESLKS